MTQVNSINQDRLGALDGLRGLMSLWVLLGHTCAATGMQYVPILRSPHYAVDGFMILSGFLMTYHYILRIDKEPWTHPRTWITFYIRRFFRLTPVYYLLLIPAYFFKAQYDQWRSVVHRLVDASQQLPANPTVSLEHVLLHLTYLFGLVPAYHASIVLPDWSLSLEMQFYLAFPFLMLLVLRFGWTWVSLIGAGTWFAATSPRIGLAKHFVQPAPLVLSLVWFLIGILWASAHLDRNPSSSARKVLLGCGLSLLSRDPHDIILVAVFAWLMSASGRLSFGRTLPSIRALLSSRISSFLADSSYSVYLTHLLILVPTSYILCTRFQMSPPFRFLVASIVTILFSYGMAGPLEIVERAGIRMGKRLTGSKPALQRSGIVVPA